MSPFNGDSEFFNRNSCVVYSKSIPSRNFKANHFGDISATNYGVIFPVFMMQASLFFFSSRLVYLLLRPLKQPIIVCNILTGILLGPSLLGRNQAIMGKIFPQNELVLVNTVAMLGGVYFTFIETVKMDKARILRTAKYAWNVSLTSILVTFVVTLTLIHLLRKYFPGPEESGRIEIILVILCVNLSLPYFPVVAHAMTELKLLNSELGQLAMSCSILSEMATWGFVALSMLLFGTIKQKFQSELCLCALLFFTILFIRPIVLSIIRRIPEGKPVHEMYIIGLLLLPLVMGVLTDMIGMTFWPGALLAGLVIPPGPPLGSALVEKCGLITSNILLPFLYICVGQLTNIYSIRNLKAFAAISLIFIGSVLAKMFGCLLALLYFKTSTRNAIILSLSLNLRGVNELLVAIRWKTNLMLDEATYTSLILGYMILTAIITPLINICCESQTTVPKASTDHYNPRITLQKIPVDVELRILCGIHYEHNVHSIITLLKSFNPTKASPICAYVVHLQELLGRATPLLAPYINRGNRLLLNSTDHIMRAVTNNLESSRVPVTLQLFTMIAPYSTMHQSICRLAGEKSIPLILLPFHRSQEAQERALSLHNLDMNMQEYSPCTVGIFVDRGLPGQLSSTRLSYHVAVFFLGGPDDREAMALVSRMSEHPDVGITMFRILFTADYDGKEENESERKLDDSVISRFLSKNRSNPRVAFNEVVAGETMQVIDAIRSAEKEYDLVMVGKRRVTGSRLEQEMKPWVEHEELGEIGDLLASKDFCGGMMFVLVIQCVGAMSITEKRTNPSSASSICQGDVNVRADNTDLTRTSGSLSDSWPWRTS